MSNGQDSNNDNPQMQASAGAASQFDEPANSLDAAAGSIPFADFGTLSPSKAMVPAAVPRALSLNSMLDVPMPIVFEVGRTNITIAHLMELREGSFINLRNVSVDVIDVRVDEQIIAEGEAISLQQRYGVRISEVTRLPSGEENENES